jgi:hypothetical protein
VSTEATPPTPQTTVASHGGWQWVDRGQATTLVLWPGWAFDARVFEPLADALAVNVLRPHAESHGQPPPLDNPHIDGTQVVHLGWSLGARRALKFLRQSGRTDRLLAVGLRPTFSADDLAAHRAGLRSDAPTFLRDFYRRAFLGQKVDGQWFADSLLEPMLADIHVDRLIAELDELAEPIRSSDLAGIDIRLMSGERDRIAPASLWDELAAENPAWRPTIIPATGHAAFLSSEGQAWCQRHWNG